MSISKITNKTAVTIHELETYYEVENIYEYICESVVNGQHEQARKIAKECKDMLNYSYTDLRDSSQNFGDAIEDKVLEIFCN